MRFERSIEIELFQYTATMADAMAGQDFQIGHKRCGFASAMGFHQTDDDIDTIGTQPSCSGKHGIGLAHAGCRPQKNDELAPAVFIRQGKQCIGVRAARIAAIVIRH